MKVEEKFKNELFEGFLIFFETWHKSTLVVSQTIFKGILNNSYCTHRS